MTVFQDNNLTYHNEAFLSASDLDIKPNISIQFSVLKFSSIIIDDALNQISKQRAVLGAAQSMLVQANQSTQGVLSLLQ